MEKALLLVCEGPTDYHILKAIAAHLGETNTVTHTFIPVSPQIDATSGTTSEGHGFGQVLNWCRANRDRIPMLLAFRSANAVFIQMDTDIAKQINKSFGSANQSARQCCEAQLNACLDVTQEPTFCRYILPTQSTETWLLACYDKNTHPNVFPHSIQDYETITDTEQRLLNIGYSHKGRKLKKDRKKYEEEYAPLLLKNLPLARTRCKELDRLCHLLT